VKLFCRDPSKLYVVLAAAPVPAGRAIRGDARRPL